MDIYIVIESLDKNRNTVTGTFNLPVSEEEVFRTLRLEEDDEYRIVDSNAPFVVREFDSIRYVSEKFNSYNEI